MQEPRALQRCGQRHREKLEEHCKKLTTYKEAAEERVKATNSEPFFFTLEDVSTAGGLAKDSIKAVNSVLATYEKAF